MNIKKYYSWWIHDYNPLDGRLRIVFYLLLLYLAYNSVIPGAISRLEACPESFFEADGLMQFLLPAGVTSTELASILFYARYVLIFSWICAAIGLFGRISSLTTGIGVFIFWGAMKSCAGTGHDWYLPMYSLLFLGLFSRYDHWSADYWLSRTFSWYPFRRFSPGNYGGLARKLILLTTVFILFAGGIAKLFTGGPEWLTGESLYYYLVEFNQPSHSIGPILLDFFLENSWIITILAVWTVLLELCSVAILFKKNWRLLYVLNLWAFHIGIYLLMFPRYFPSMVCYLLIVNWRHTFAQIEAVYSKYLDRLPYYNTLYGWLAGTTVTGKRSSSTGTFKRVLFPSALSVVFLITILFRLESFPLTYVPMYSTILTEEKIGSFNRADFNRRESLHRIAERYAGGEQPWYIKFHYPRRIEIRLWYREHGESGVKTKDITEEYKGLIRNWAKWNQAVTEITLPDMSNGRLFTEKPAKDSETARLLEEIKSIMSDRGGYKQIEKVALVYHFDDNNEEILADIE